MNSVAWIASSKEMVAASMETIVLRNNNIEACAKAGSRMADRYVMEIEHQNGT